MSESKQPVKAEKFLTADDILNAKDIKREKITIPEWGGCFYVYEMTSEERDDFEASMVTQNEEGKSVQNMKNFRAELCVRTMRNKNGKRFFRSKTDVAKLGEKSASAIGKIFNVATKLNAIGPKDVEDLTKN